VFRYARRLAAEFTQADASSVPEDDPLETLPGDTFLGLDLSGWIVHAHLPYFERMRDRGVALYFVVYDLLPILRPDAFPTGSDWFPRWLEAVTSVGDGTICISRAVADELVGWLETAPVERQRRLDIGHFHLGADIPASAPTGGVPPDAESILAAMAKRPYLLMVGTLEPRKGHAQTLAAFERLWADGVDVGLVIVGTQGWMVEPLAERLRGHAELGTRLLWPDDVSDEMLLRLYGSAAALLAASEGEGFGLPLVEAAQHGLPIIARDLPVFREVAGEHAFYFDGRSADNLAAAISAWLALRESGEAPSSEQMPWLTWAQSTAQLMDVILNGHWYSHWSTR
jgi:glycosyltransferase involved in cell wall biosynthesis